MDAGARPPADRRTAAWDATAFSLLVLTEPPHPTRLFLKKSRTSLPCPVQSRSENALADSAEVVKPGRVAAIDRRSGTLLAEALLRLQHPQSPAVRGKASLHPSQSGEAWLVRASRRLGVEQFSPLCDGKRGMRRD